MTGRTIDSTTQQVLNWYRHREGYPPANTATEQVVTDEEWAKMSAAAKAELWSKYPIKERP